MTGPRGLSSWHDGPDGAIIRVAFETEENLKRNGSVDYRLIPASENLEAYEAVRKRIEGHEKKIEDIQAEKERNNEYPTDDDEDCEYDPPGDPWAGDN